MSDTGAAAAYDFFGRAIIFAAVGAALIRLIPVVYPFGNIARQVHHAER